MITCARNGFCFFHVPKSGGTTIRLQIQDLDDYNLKFGSDLGAFPEGRFRMAHLPLAVLQSQFPEVFATIRGLNSFAVVRDPKERFYSAFGQHLKETHGKFSRELSDGEVRDMLATIRDHVSNSAPYPDARYAHFLRQTDFTHLDGVRFVKTIVPIEDFRGLITPLSRLSGRELDPNMKLNQSVNFRSRRLKTPIIAIKDKLKAVLPLNLYSCLKDAALPVLTDRGGDERLHVIAKELGMPEFIEEHYACDETLRREVFTTLQASERG